MSDLLLALLPVFALMLLGRVLRRHGVLSATGVDDLGKLLYWVLLPVRLFAECARADVRHAIEGSAVLAAVIAFIAGSLVAGLAGRRLPPTEQGCIISGVARANGAFVGLPVIALLAVSLPPGGAVGLNAAYAVILGCMVPLFNAGAVIGFRLPHHGLTWAGIRAVLGELPRNPIILGSGLGVLVGLWHPGLLDGTVPGHAIDLLGGAAVPLALLITGAGLDVSIIRGRPLLLVTSAIAKLVLVPLTCWLACRLLDVSTIGTLAATVLMASPVAMASAPMARLLGGDDRLMSAIIVTTTLASPLTLFGWLWFLT